MSRVRKKQSTYTSAEHDILGGRGKILRVKASGDVWQFRMWIEDEGKYLRQSLKTRDLETAVKKAEEHILQTLSDVATGRKIFGITLKELTEGYIKYREKDVETGLITAGRLVTIKSQLKNFLKQKSSDLKIAELDRKSFYEFATSRKLDKKNTRDVTIRNEQSTINHMMTWAWREGVSHFDKFEFRKLKIDQNEEVHRRDTFTLEEYDALVRFLRSYASEKVCSDKTERLERLMIKDAVLIASNTMLRMGELTNLKWGDIAKIEKTSDAGGKQIHLVTINVRAETAKTRRRRTVVSRGGEYFLRLKERSAYSSKNDYVFASIGGTSKLNKQKWYIHWKTLMNGIALDYKKRNVTWYSLRHFGITCRLRAQVSHFDISKLAGTAVANIERHYGHIDTRMLQTAARKTFSISKDGLDVFDQ